MTIKHRNHEAFYVIRATLNEGTVALLSARRKLFVILLATLPGTNLINQCYDQAAT
jgi:hypothetical protein